jgi:hypothetical protein
MRSNTLSSIEQTHPERGTLSEAEFNVQVVGKVRPYVYIGCNRGRLTRLVVKRWGREML